MKSAEEILALDDRPLERVEVPEWSTHVYVRSLGSEKAAEVRGMVLQIQNLGPHTESAVKLQGKWRAECILHGVCHEDGAPLFTTDHAALLMKRNARVIERLVQHVLRLSNADADGQEALEKK